MVCIYCGSGTNVTNSRHQKRLNQVWRRRTCVKCHATFSTTESIELSGSILLHRKARLDPFSREQLLISLYDSLRHRPSALTDASALCATIISHLAPLITDATIERDDLVTITIEALDRFDKAAATHYAAFHKI